MSALTKARHLMALAFLALLLGACTLMASPARHVQGTFVHTVNTPFDILVECIKRNGNMDGTWAVGEIRDLTGKFTQHNSGPSRLISQGAGDMMQTMLLQAGAEQTVNRRDARPVQQEMNWGLRKAAAFTAMDYYITGSINVLDFLPRSSAKLSIGGIGPRFSQDRAIVGLDLHLTDARTTRVVSAVNISKQIFTEYAGFGIGRIFGTTYVSMDISGGSSEPLQMSLRAMLQYGLYEMLAKRHPLLRSKCQSILNDIEGIGDPGRTNGEIQEKGGDPTAR